MKKDRLYTELQALERKIRLLLTDHHVLVKENEMLKKENVDLQNVIRNKDAQLADFQNRINITTIVDSITAGDVHVSEVKEKLNEYIKEIDKCIHYLNH
ncbi:MAG: hypothetical protein JJU28_20375 [Cyclobacteriaceae bacterium]|nr:hypothetical protein [Cyclobacteriaceae bacterium]